MTLHDDALRAIKNFWVACRRKLDGRLRLSGPFTAEEAVVEHSVLVVSHAPDEIATVIFTADSREVAEERARDHFASPKTTREIPKPE
jgi:hypothetical protein